MSRAAQRMHHQEVAGAERAVEPLGVPQPSGELAEPCMDALVEHRRARRIPGLVALQNPDGDEIQHRRLNRVERGKHPRDRARPGIRIVWQQPRMALRDMENDRPRLEEGEIAFFIGRNLPERMKHAMRGFFHLTERKKTNLVRLAHFFKRPANPCIPREPLATIG